MADKPEVILLRETLLVSVARDMFTFFMALCLIGVGVLADSSAMQWVGAIVFFFMFMAKVRNTVANASCSIAQARTRLDELEASR